MTGTFDLALGFAGGLRDGVTGLVRFGLRDYDPASGRFVAKDPSFFSGSPQNLYNYAGNNPVTMRDPSGLVCIGWSMYATFGGGVQLCRENKWDLDADWSVCGEAGLGLGGGADLDFMGGAADTGGTAFAELTGKAGWVGGTIGAELDLGCMNAKAGAKVMVGNVTVGADTGGGFAGGIGQNDLPMPGASSRARSASRPARSSELRCPPSDGGGHYAPGDGHRWFGPRADRGSEGLRSGSAPLLRGRARPGRGAQAGALRARGGVWFEAGAQQLHVGVEDGFQPARKAHPAFRVDALDELAAALQAAGTEVLWDHELVGVRRFYVADPWGNRVELLA